MIDHIFINLQVEREKELGINTVSLPREDWDTWDPTLISEGLFAAANIFSSLKLVYIFSVNPYLGPLQVTEIIIEKSCTCISF